MKITTLAFIFLLPAAGRSSGLDFVIDVNAAAQWVTNLGNQATQISNQATQIDNQVTQINNQATQLQRLGDPSSLVNVLGVTQIGSTMTNVQSLVQKTGNLATIASNANGGSALNWTGHGMFPTLGQNIALPDGSSVARNDAAYRPYDYIRTNANSFEAAMQQDKANQQVYAAQLANLSTRLDAATTDSDIARINAAIGQVRASQQASTDAVAKSKAELDASTQQVNALQQMQAQAEAEAATAQAAAFGEQAATEQAATTSKVQSDMEAALKLSGSTTATGIQPVGVQ